MNRRHELGFSLVEVMVAVVLAGVIFVGLFASISSIFAITEGSSQRFNASNLAYSNMRIFADGSAPTWFMCDTNDETAPVTILSTTGQVANLPSDVIQVVTATAPYGCDGGAKGYPILVTSRVELANGIEVEHATYTTF